MTRKGFKGPHNQITKDRISKSLKGKRPGGFNIKVVCEFCDENIAKPNLKRHQVSCKQLHESLHIFPNGITLRKIKSFRRVLSQYGLSIDDYLKIHKLQNGKCKICKKPELKRRLFVDHCHKTKKVRGLLCYKCNTVLGMSEDDPKILQEALEYLKKD